MAGFMTAVSKGPLGRLGRLLWFLLLCFILFIIGIVKGAIFGPLAALIFFVGIMAVVIGLWPVHVVVIYRTLLMTKQLGILLKFLVILLLPIPLLLYPAFAAVGSLMAGLGYGIGQPLVATFEAVGESRTHKFYHTFVDGTISTLTGSCTVVRDFLDFTYHSIFDYLDEFRVADPHYGKPVDIKLKELPACVFVGVLGVLVDTPAISLVALCKSPVMLYKGWSQLFCDLVGRHGPCLEAACVPFAGLALVLWPLIVGVAVLTAVFCSPFLGLFGAVVVYQEMSFKSGLAYLVAIVAEFDEYSNDILHMHEGSCLPRPKYRKNVEMSKVEAGTAKPDIETSQPASEKKDAPEIPQLNTQKSLRHAIQEVKLVQVSNTIFKNMEMRGKYLVDAGVLKPSDLETYIKSSKCPKRKIVSVGIPAYSSFHALLFSAKQNTSGLLLSDGTEVTMLNRPKDRFTDWFFEPLLTLKDQLRAVHLKEEEERYLEKYILMIGDTDRMEKWDNGGVEPEDEVRLGELQAIARRIQGIATSVSRLPTHRRRFEGTIKKLYAYSQDKGGASGFETSKSRNLSLRKSNSRSSIRKQGASQFGSSRDAIDMRQSLSREINSPHGDEEVV